MKHKKYLIWDWNGTLLNDVDISIESINYLLKKQNLEVFSTKDEYRKVFQFPIIEYYKKAGFDFKKVPFDKLAIDYMSYYQPKSFSCSLHEGVPFVLDHFYKSGYKQYLLSASKLDFLHEQLEQYHIEHYFHEILGLQDIHAYSKKDLAYEFVKKQKLDPREVVFIGDSVHDYEVADCVGCDSILIANGHEHKDKLLRTKAKVMREIKEILTLFP